MDHIPAFAILPLGVAGRLVLHAGGPPVNQAESLQREGSPPQEDDAEPGRVPEELPELLRLPRGHPGDEEPSFLVVEEPGAGLHLHQRAHQPAPDVEPPARFQQGPE
ncbi:MAG: hypothetical protein DRN06_07165, partial [Thermoprotei archaeon]